MNRSVESTDFVITERLISILKYVNKDDKPLVSGLIDKYRGFADESSLLDRRTCNQCGETKPIDLFNDARTLSITHVCTDCDDVNVAINYLRKKVDETAHDPMCCFETEYSWLPMEKCYEYCKHSNWRYLVDDIGYTIESIPDDLGGVSSCNKNCNGIWNLSRRYSCITNDFIEIKISLLRLDRILRGMTKKKKSIINKHPNKLINLIPSLSNFLLSADRGAVTQEEIDNMLILSSQANAALVTELQYACRELLQTPIYNV